MTRCRALQLPKRFTLLGVTCLALLALGSPHAGADAMWRSWDRGLREAGSAKRPILVDVYTDWCGWCKRMDRDVYGRAEVREYLQRRFVTIKLDAESTTPASYKGKRTSESGIASHFRVTGYPTTIFLKPDGEKLANVPGYVPADRFLLLLRYIGDGHYERGVSFEDFSRSGSGTGAR